MIKLNSEEAVILVQQCGGRPGNLVKSCGEWMRLFVHNSEGVQVGRLTFRHGNLKYIKCYKRDYHRSVDETDLIFVRLHIFASTGKLISEEKFWEGWARAQRDVRADMAAARVRREALPPKKRPKLQGRNPRTVLQRLLRAAV